MATAERPWSVVVRVDEIPEAGRHLKLEASEATRAALAGPAGVDAVDRLVATFDLTRRGRHGLHVGGRVSGIVRQTCVVSLGPLVNEVDETVDVDFTPVHAGANDALELDIPYHERSADEPEPLMDGTVDLGLLATEFLILGVDPYPRKTGAKLEAPPPAAEPAEGPFGALAGWQKKGTVKE